MAARIGCGSVGRSPLLVHISYWRHFRKVLDIGALDSPPWPDGIAATAQINRAIQEWHGKEDELRSRLDDVKPM